ncbi:MAG: metallophosphoesterase, partial [Clostridia bacterium]|nr:metallophosphoesterase [Clostridia bacterium]
MKKSVFRSKKLMISLLLIAVILTGITVLASAQEESIPGFKLEAYNDTIEIGDVEYAYPEATYVIQKHFDKMPQTVSAWVYVPSSITKSEVGTIIGNIEGRQSESGIDFKIGAGAIPTISIKNKYKGANKLHYDVSFENAAVNTDAWSYVTFVYDNESGIASCYIDGECKQEKYFYPEIDEEILVNNFVFGGDNKELNHGYFKGGLGDLTVYSDVRSADEIKADFDKGLSMNKSVLDNNDLILYYDIDENDIGKNITDDSGNGYGAIFEKIWITESEMEDLRDYGFEPSYSFAVVGDTQKATRFYPQNLPYIYDYIVKNIENKNIKFSIGLGDITDKDGREEGGSFIFVENESEPGGGHYERSSSGTANEWDVAKHAISIMDGVLDYSLIEGNHDGSNTFNSAFNNDNFAYASQYLNYGGMYNNSINNAWRTFTVGNVKYLIMNIAYRADSAVIEWANEVLGREEHKDYNVIITTHAYLDCDGTALDSGDINCGTKNSGVYLWEELVSKHANVKLMLSGHVDADKIVYSQRQGINGNTVTQILVNAQSLDLHAMGPAMVAMFNFSEDGQKLAIEFYSTVRGLYLKNPKIINLMADAPIIEEDDGWMGNSIAPTGTGTESDPYIVSSGGNLLWMAEQVAMGTSASLDGAYFEQTQDIDLNGNSIYSIGYYFGGQSDMAAFGGHYDGNGYSIKNGTVAPAGRGYESSVKYGYGLFGVIFGATVENVVLENIEVVGLGLTGGIVGRAAAPLVSDVNFAGFNIISGCEIKDTVKFVLSDINPLSDINFDNAARGGRFGSVCGMAHGTVIEACTSDVDIKFGGDYGLGGGIVGSFGLNSTVKSCAFTGSMSLVDSKATQTCIYGGIAGIVSPSTKWGTDYVGYAHINNCYNGGNLYFETSSLTKNTHWAGILGGAPWIPYVTSTEEIVYPYLVEGCYNLSAGPERISTNSVYAGIVGKNVATANVTSTLYVKDCYSVKITNAGGDTGTNEYRYESGTKTLDGLDAVCSLGTVTTVSADEASAAADVINADIMSTRLSELSVIWYSGKGEPTFTPAKNDVKYYDSDSSFYYTYDGSKWKMAGGELTDYGVIPDSYSNVDAYPFVIFKNGEFKGAGDAWNTSKYDGVIANAIALATDKDDVVTVVLRRNYDHTQSTTLNTFNNLVGTLNIDLGTNTITTARELVQFNHKINANTVKVNIKNGTIKVTGRRLASLQNQSSTTRQDLKLTFE